MHDALRDSCATRWIEAQHGKGIEGERGKRGEDVHDALRDSCATASIERSIKLGVCVCLH